MSDTGYPSTGYGSSTAGYGSTATASRGTTIGKSTAQQGGIIRTVQVKLYNFLQWYLSFFYYGAGAAWGTTRGFWSGSIKYISTLLYSAWGFFFGKAPPKEVIHTLEAVAPEPSAVIPVKEALTPAGAGESTAARAGRTAHPASHPIESKAPTYPQSGATTGTTGTTGAAGAYPSKAQQAQIYAAQQAAQGYQGADRLSATAQQVQSSIRGR